MVQITAPAQTEFFPQVQRLSQGYTPSRRIPAYLYLKRKIYYFRYALPKERKATLGQTEVRPCLKTAHIREAVFRSSQMHRMLMVPEGESLSTRIMPGKAYVCSWWDIFYNI